MQHPRLRPSCKPPDMGDAVPSPTPPPEPPPGQRLSVQPNETIDLCNLDSDEIDIRASSGNGMSLTVPVILNGYATVATIDTAAMLQLLAKILLTIWNHSH